MLPIEPHILYGCKASSVTLREHYKLRLFEKREFRRIFGPKMKSGSRLDKIV
jgi:hypothetical protein